MPCYPIIAKVEFESDDIKPIKFNVRAQIVKMQRCRCEKHSALRNIEAKGNLLSWYFRNSEYVIRNGMVPKEMANASYQQFLEHVVGKNGLPFCWACWDIYKEKIEMQPYELVAIKLYAIFKRQQLVDTLRLIDYVIFPYYSWKTNARRDQKEIRCFVFAEKVEKLCDEIKAKAKQFAEGELKKIFPDYKVNIIPCKVTTRKLEKAYKRYIARKTLRAI